MSWGTPHVHYMLNLWLCVSIRPSVRPSVTYALRCQTFMSFTSSLSVILALSYQILWFYFESDVTTQNMNRFGQVVDACTCQRLQSYDNCRNIYVNFEQSNYVMHAYYRRRLWEKDDVYARSTKRSKRWRNAPARIPISACPKSRYSATRSTTLRAWRSCSPAAVRDVPLQARLSLEQVHKVTRQLLLLRNLPTSAHETTRLVTWTTL